ncbi:MAG: FkbM family methyltransferase [Acidimicrobiales bacterium]
MALRSLESRVRWLRWTLWRFWSDIVAVWRHGDPATRRLYVWAIVTSLPEIVRTSSLVPADRKMAGRVCSFRPQPDCVIEVDGGDFSAAREMYCRRVYFARDGFDIRPGETVVDLGANIGLFTTMAAVSGARVIAVEAQSGFLPAMRANLRRNGGEDRAEIVQALVGAETGVLSTEENRRSASAWGDEPDRMGMTELLDRYGVTHVDLLKIDIEGSEFDLFRDDGFLSGVRRLAMEVHPTHGDVRELRSQVERHGFDVALLDSEGRPADALSGARGGYLFATRTG